MNDTALLKAALQPKSDQLNADDLITGYIDIVIRKVTVAASGEQRIAFYYHGDDNKPYKPGKAMGRLIMEVWGDEPAKYIGRGLRLYRDPDIKFGKDQVGGIRISHMTDLKETMSIPITTKRGERKPWVVKPLVMQAQTAGNTALAYDPESAKAKGRVEAAKGVQALKTWWTAQAGHHAKIGGEAFLNELKEIAVKAAQVAVDPNLTVQATTNAEPEKTSTGDDEVPFDV